MTPDEQYPIIEIPYKKNFLGFLRNGVKKKSKIGEWVGNKSDFDLYTTYHQLMKQRSKK